MPEYTYNSENGRQLQLNTDKDTNLTQFAREVLKDRYMLPDEQSPQEAFARAACAFSDDSEHAQRLYNYSSDLWFMFSTPILSNGGTKRGMPISCFLNHVDDSREGLGEHYVENIWLSSTGGGIGGNWSQVRSQGTGTSIGNKTTGIIPFMHVVDSQMLAFRQGTTRRGSYAAYLDVSHPEIEEFIVMRKSNGGDINRKNLNLHHGVNISDAFMRAVMDNSVWSLIDPHTGHEIKTVPARELWIKILKTRVETGEPYLHFIDTSNEMLPQPLKDKGLRINHTNLCSEIYLPTNSERTAVCCLSSVNLEKFEEWQGNDDFIEDMCRMLDNVLTFFIDQAPDTMWRAIRSARSERSIGIGAMGFHSFLQKNDIPFDSILADSWNRKMFKHIKFKASMASVELAEERGSAPDMGEHPLRFSHLLAIAPNASSSILCGTTSPSIEPWTGNSFVQKTLTGSHAVKNKFLDEKLSTKYNLKDKELEKVWSSILVNQGSVQQLDFLDKEDKEVFKTAIELDQFWVIKHAGARQEYICQGQSVNVFIRHDENIQYVHDIHKLAWEEGLKGLYYCRSEAARKAEKVSEKVERVERKDWNEEDTCMMCEG